MYKKRIPYGRHHITDEDIQAVVDVLKSDWLTQGPTIKAFEDAFSDYVGSKYAVAVSNGTAALHLNAIALGIQPGDKVITTPITFIASANCVKYCGGEIIFSDIDPETYLLDIRSVEKILNEDKNREIKGIILVNFAGLMNDMEAYRKLADKYNLWIIEDACHSPGGYFIDNNGVKQSSGNGYFADLSIFSFHPVKHIAAGEGGMITTNNKELYKKLLNLRSHGIQQDATQLIFDNSMWYYEMQELGYNSRLTDFQAALGLSQLKRAKEGLKKRKEIVKKYYNAFKGLDFIKSSKDVIDGHAYHLYIIEVERRDELFEYLRGLNIIVQIHYIPVHLMPYYRSFDWKKGDMPNAETYYRNCLSLPIFPTLLDGEQEFVIESVKRFYE